MASLRSAMCCSHAPGLLQVDDTSDARKRLNAGYAAAAARMSATPLDFVVFVIDDHLDNYFLNSMPTFALGAAPRYGVADEGIGGYWDGELHGSEAALTALAKGLVGRGFDLAISYDDMVLDHAVTIPFPRLFPENAPAIVPLVVNCVWSPIPSAARVWQLGQAIREVLAEWDEDLSYGLIATGGMSHQLSGYDFGTIDETFDRKVLEIICGDRRSQLAEWSEDDLRVGGDGALELLNWIAVAGAVGDEAGASVLAYEPMPAAVTGMGVICYDLPQESQGGVRR